MAGEVKVNRVDQTAADALLTAIDRVGGEAQVVILLQNKDSESEGVSSLHVITNCSHADAYWLLSKGRHATLDDHMEIQRDEEEPPDAS